MTDELKLDTFKAPKFLLLTFDLRGALQERINYDSEAALEAGAENAAKHGWIAATYSLEDVCRPSTGFKWDSDA